MMASDDSRAKNRGDVCSERIVVQSALGLPVRTPCLDEKLARTSQERSPLCFAAPPGYGAEFVEGEWFASGAQDPETAYDGRIDRDAIPQLGVECREAARDRFDAPLGRRHRRQVLPQHHRVFQVADRASDRLVDEAHITPERWCDALPERPDRRVVVGRERRLV